jgi:precorrin-6y C5,15-methyltransferase (decarboxylating) CbiE subunit
MEMTVRSIAIVGCGPGAASYVTGEARTTVAAAGALIGAQRLLDLFPESQAQRTVVRGSVESTIEAVEQHRDSGVAVLVTGDPGIASLARGVIAHFGRDACHIIAGVSSVQVAFARLGVDWADARIVSAHSAEPLIDFSGLAAERKIAILAGSGRAASWAASLAEYLGVGWRFFLAGNLTLPGECVREIAPSELREEPLPALAVLVFLRSHQL